MILRLLLSTVIIAALTLPKVCYANADKKSDKPLTLCELVEQPGAYDRQTVTVGAIYLVGAEQALLYDPQCRNGEYLTYVDFSKLRAKFPGKLKRLEKSDKRALVVFEGIFYGPEPLEIDPKLPQYLKDKMAGTKRRYGHMDSLETMIEVTTIKDVEQVPVETPY